VKSVLLAVLAVAVPTLSMAEPLWGNVEAGASLTDIKNSYPDGRVVEPTEGQKIKSGAMMRYRISSVPIVGESFRAEFYLLGGKLEQVTLALEATKNSYECQHTTEAVIEALIAKYGTPVKRDGSTTSTDYSWSIGKTTISLFGMNLPSINSCSLSIFYNQRIAASSDNL